MYVFSYFRNISRKKKTDRKLPQKIREKPVQKEDIGASNRVLKSGKFYSPQ